eukprot:CAMPEP_0197072460 /NCGR_PEP_ID=MMETSP1384-20130603/210108_1 /TAXON_ID=29189 /ORGANISM="Ammonia sp." /LENGTH=496 /DNA_ID=CAMNT_0042511277 /DNA_START=138 /DNA_END=1628 /DNA_ORIENTATION=+
MTRRLWQLLCITLFSCGVFGQGCADQTTTREVVAGRIYGCPGTFSGGGTRGAEAAALCASDYHVCESAQEATDLGLTTDLCRNVAQTASEFFGTQETSYGGWSCESVNGNPNDLTNDIWGCASTSASITGLNNGATCLSLTSAIGNSGGTYWQAGTGFTSTTEADTYKLVDAAGGGVLCCVDEGLSSSVLADLESAATTENGLAWVHAIYAAHGGSWTFSEPFNDMVGFVNIARYAKSIKFTSPSGTYSAYATECSNPVWALNHGLSLALTYDESTGQATGTQVSSNWNGPSTAQMWNGCTRDADTSITTRLFDACHNANGGLHLYRPGSEAKWWDRENDVNIYLGFDASWSTDCYGTVLDENECALGTHSCDSNAVCTNTAGSYTCECNTGYSGDGYSCTDDDECALGTDDCSTKVQCVNSAGSFECVYTAEAPVIVVPYSYVYTAAFLLVLSYVALYYVMKICCFAKQSKYAAVNLKYSDSDIEESEAQIMNNY